MGEDVGHHEFSRADRTRYREKIRRCLDVFARMLRDERFEADDPMTGLEVELNLVDDRGEPAMRNVEALEAIANPGTLMWISMVRTDSSVCTTKAYGVGGARSSERPGLRSSRSPWRRGRPRRGW